MIEPARPIGSRTAEDVSDMQCLLLEAYRHIGEPDSVYGACSTHVADHTTRLLLYEHEGEWHKSLSTSAGIFYNNTLTLYHVGLHE